MVLGLLLGPQLLLLTGPLQPVLLLIMLELVLVPSLPMVPLLSPQPGSMDRTQSLIVLFTGMLRLVPLVRN